MNMLCVEPRSYWKDLGLLREFDNVECVEFGVFSLRSFENSLRNRKIQIVATCVYHSTLSLYLSFICKKYKVPMVYFSDGVGDFKNFLDNTYVKKIGVRQMIPPHYPFVFCSDFITHKMLINMGWNSYEYRSDRVYSSNGGNMGSPSYDFLITTANSPFFDLSERNRGTEIISQIISELDKQGLSYAFRFYDEDLIKCIPTGKANIIDGDLNEALSNVRAVITTPSSVVIGAIQNDRPVGIIDYRSDPIMLQTGWRFHLSSDVSATLRSMLSPDNARLSVQYGLLAKDEGVSQRLKEILNEISPLDSHEEKFYTSKFTISLEYMLRSAFRMLKHLTYVKNIVNWMKKKGIR